METLYKRSMEEKIKLEMIYVTKQGELSQRTVRIIEVRNSHILAYCFSKRQVRSFLKENVLSVLPVQKRGRNIGA
ncbi:hypothetical protein LCL89_03995 [Halobacillus yeomjeoni]|uniref:hypothetical protein n=1 Tax=Halobacillus yeomjeoni TaxID=311194 RepID=UPI001CD69B6B|nr:hypothetical protein [Halobacillus yeomjeoni]MCA0983209.1 hypothetical protein [Halobacillus yeomjeoni]